MNCKQTKTTTNNWGQIMINLRSTINCALAPIVSAGVQFNIHSNNYIIERLSIRPLQAVEEHFDLVIDRQYLTAKNPEWHVLYRSMFHLQDLKNLQSVLDQLLIWET